MNQISYRRHKIKEALKGRDLKYIFSSSINVFCLIVLAIRSLLLRLIPRITKMYFIRKDFSGFPVEISKTEFEFKIFSTFSDEIKTFVLNRCSEDPRLIPEVYSNLVSDRLVNGFKAFSLLNNDKVVSIFFTSEKSTFIEQVNYSFEPQSGEVLISDIYTMEESRKKGLYSLLLKHTIKYYRQKGICIFVMWIMKHNRVTIQAQLKSGFTEIFRTVTLFSWLGLESNSVNSTNKMLGTL